MIVPVWVMELAASFWAKARGTEGFPRQLLRPIARAVPLYVVLTPQLTIASVLRQIRSYGIACDLRAPDRALRACLVARHGHGIAFIDGTDPDDERRFSIAHELAHFLRDYIRRRERALKLVGPSAQQVLDGWRRPSVDERFSSLLTRTPLGFDVHLMDRTGDAPLQRAIAEAEESADRLAYELLAPVSEVSALVSSGPRNFDPRELTSCLVDHFGLPARQAAHYAGLLLPGPRRVDPFLNKLRIAADSVEL